MSFSRIKVNGIVGLAVGSPHMTEEEKMALLLEAFGVADDNNQSLRLAVVDLALTEAMMEVLRQIDLFSQGRVVMIADHHKDKTPEQERRIRELETFCAQVRVVDRAEHPSCVSLIRPGQWLDEQVNVVLFHADGDGLLSFLTGACRENLNLQRPAEILDGVKRERGEQTPFLVEIMREYLYAVPMFTVDRKGFLHGQAKVFQTIADAFNRSLIDRGTMLWGLHKEVMNAAEKARRIANDLVAKHRLMEGGVVYVNTLPVLRQARHIHFHLLRSSLETLYWGKNILLVTTGLGVFEGKVGEAAFINLSRNWPSDERPDLRTFLTRQTHQRHSAHIMIPLSQLKDFHHRWLAWTRDNPPQ